MKKNYIFFHFFELNEGNLDFDILSANSTVVSRTLTIFNHGTKSGSFRLKYLGQEIKFSQLLGKIKPGKSTEISAEIVTDKPKILEELVEIYLSGEKNLGSFYKSQLKPTDQSIYRIDRVLRRRRNAAGEQESLVKWRDYDDKSNT